MQPRALILMYHRVIGADSDPWSLCISPSHFAEQMQQLRQHYTVLSLTQLKTSLREHTLPRRAVVVTFDDGYHDNLREAKPILARHDVPATFFVSTGYLNADREFWWDELERLILWSPLLPSRLSVAIDREIVAWDLGSWAALPKTSRRFHADWKFGPVYPTPRHRAFRELHGRLKSLEEEQREDILAALRGQVLEGRERAPSGRPLTRRELSELAGGDLVEIGSHAVSHAALSGLSLQRRQWEFCESRRTLESVIGRPVSALSYPFGGPEDVGEETIQLAQNSGFEVGCSTVEHPVTSGSRLRWLPRVFVEDWDGDEFTRRVRAFFRAPNA